MLQESNTLKVAGVFFNEPIKSHYLMDISKRINLAHTSVKKFLDLLIKEKIIIKTIEQRGSRPFPLYKANLESSNYLQQKKIFNLLSLSKLISFIDDKLSPKSITLFGSYQNGEDIEGSDVDLFVECANDYLNLKKFEIKLNRKIQLHFGNSFLKLPKELKNNIINGIVLSGYLKGYDNKDKSR